MPSLFQSRGRWVVRYRPDGRQRETKFATEDEARAFMDANDIVVGKRGRPRRTHDEALAYIAANIEIDGAGCWLWTRRLTKEGYGQQTWLSDEGYVISGAHRLAYHLAVEPVSRELVIDHLCRVRRCVNPDHLEAVVQRENVMRSPIAPGALNAAKTHCAQGHPYSPENTYVYRHKTQSVTERICKTCRSDQRARRLAARRGVAA